jgi:hypothetical protein
MDTAIKYYYSRPADEINADSSTNAFLRRKMKLSFVAESDSFSGQELVESPATSKAAKSTLLEPAVGKCRLIVNGGGINMHRAIEK